MKQLYLLSTLVARRRAGAPRSARPVGGGRSRWLAAGAMLACACAASATNFESWPEPDTTAEEAVLSAAVAGQQRRHADANELEPLRHRAALGDADSGVQLMRELVDRYEISRNKDDLFEAVLWIDLFQGTESEARSGVLEQVSRRHCDEKVLRFHWLCAVGE